MAKENAIVKRVTRQIDPTSPPAGTSKIPRVVTEEVKPRKGRAVFKSCDGETYSLPTHGSNGQPLPERETLCILACLRELSLGGNPAPIMSAFKVKMTDVTGQVMFPLPEEDLKQVTKGFTIGD